MKQIPVLLIVFSTIISCDSFSARLSSDPFISGDSFRSLADHLFDETSSAFDPKHVKAGDIVFVKTDFLDAFFKTKHPYIVNTYILVTHNSDHPAPGIYVKYLENKTIGAWFGQNPSIQYHPKFIAIPIGIANQYWHHGQADTFHKIQRELQLKMQKKYLLGINFRPETYTRIRKPLYDYMSKQSFCTDIATTNHYHYLQYMSYAQFILSPRGNGLDCHRTWEALLVGSIPIVEHSNLDELFNNLPILIVNSWKEITPDYLEQQYKYIQTRSYNYEKIYFNYWRHLIYKYQRDIKSNFRYSTTKGS